MAHTFTTNEHEFMAYRIAIYTQRVNLPGITLSRIPNFLILCGTASIISSRLVLGPYDIFNSNLLLSLFALRLLQMKKHNYLFLKSF
jgi:hypothetical protein